MSWLFPTSAPGNVLVLAVLIPERNRFFTKIYSIWLWCVPSGLCYVHLLDGLWLPRVQSPGAWTLCHWTPDCRNFSPIFLCIFCICAIADDKICDSCIVSFWALLVFLLCLWWWWPNSNFLCCVIAQNGESSRDLLLSVTNRKALAPGGHSPP